MAEDEEACGSVAPPRTGEDLVREMNRMHEEVIAALDALVASGDYRIKSDAERQDVPEA